MTSSEDGYYDDEDDYDADYDPDYGAAGGGGGGHVTSYLGRSRPAEAVSPRGHVESSLVGRVDDAAAQDGSAAARRRSAVAMVSVAATVTMVAVR